MLAVALCGFLAICLPVTHSQIIIPKREVGFIYNNGADNADVHLDVYVDLVCPDSAETYPTLLKVADFYGPKKLQLKFHLFPLPYHRNAYYLTLGTHAIHTLTEGNSTMDWIKLVYESMPNLTNSATSKFSEDQMKLKFASLANKFGLYPELFIPLLDNSEIQLNTIIAWKYACTRGVAATPTFMVNDIVSSTASQSWTLEEWKTFLDPYINYQSSNYSGPTRDQPVSDDTNGCVSHYANPLLFSSICMIALPDLRNIFP